MKKFPLFEPAFPMLMDLPSEEQPGMTEKWQCPGMTLRDYFAAQALTRVIDGVRSAAEVALLCYRMADAMLAERENQS